MAAANAFFLFTEDYAKRMCLKKIKSSYPVIRFGGPEVTVDNMYEVPLWASGLQKITVNAVSIASIYNGPAAVCPHNITWRFLQSKKATAGDLHQHHGFLHRY
jgi:hypothetical protein